MENNGEVKVNQWLIILISMIVLTKYEVNGQTNSIRVNITRIADAEAKGAACLDGSSGAYHFDQGVDEGANNWLVYLQGGRWCNSKKDCLGRSRDKLGSTKDVNLTFFDGILSSNLNTNPDFYNCNRVFIRYSDGASFMADVEQIDPETKLYRRGRRILNAVMEELVETRGMPNANYALLLGNSAGGLATILNCDRFSLFLPNACMFKCISDSGFFIHAQDLPGADYRESYFANVTAFHELSHFLPESCTSRLAPGLCLFPENVVDDIQTPLFLLNSHFDQFQISVNLKPNPPNDVEWTSCTKEYMSMQNCTASQFHIIKDFQTAFLQTLSGLGYIWSRGLYISSCYIHDFVYRPNNWQGLPTLGNKMIGEAVGDWYMERSRVRLVDAYPYPLDCNTTTYN